MTVVRGSPVAVVSFPYVTNADGSLRRVFLSNGKYCTESRVAGSRCYIPLDPQPDKSSVITLTRYYGTSTMDSNFSKRVTWIADRDGEASTALVEYKGKQPNPSLHGNAQKLKTPYVRTPADTMDKVLSSVAHGKPKAVYNERLLNSADPVDAPRNVQSVQDKKRYQQQLRRKATNTVHRMNFADEILQVLAMAQTDDFVRGVHVTGSRVPSVVLFTDRQLKDIRSFCFHRHLGTVLGFDKTFNLGSMYVTVTCYSNLALNHTKTGCTPTFIGPLFIHGHSDIDTFNYLFGRIASRLHDMNFQVSTQR